MVVAQQIVPIIETTDLPRLYETMQRQKVSDISDQLIQKVLQNTKQSTTAPDGYNFGINDGSAAGQSVPHAHLHIMPRWLGDVANPRGGVRNMFSGDPYSST